MKNFLKTVLAVIIGLFASLCLMLLTFIVIASVSSQGEGELEVKPNSVLELHFKEPVYEFSEAIRIKDFNFEVAKDNTLPAILRAIKYAKTDDNIKGIVISSVEGVQGKAHLANIHKAVADFKTSGKFVYAFSESASQYDYFLQSVADSIFVGTLGSVEVKGLSAEVLYLKDFEDKTGVKMEVFRHGKYKSAVEPFLENKMSEANREQIGTYLQSLWESYLSEVTQSRNLSRESLNKAADSLWGRTAEQALKHHLVDRIAFRDEFENSLCKATGSKEWKDIRLIPIERYTKEVTEKHQKEALKRIKNDKIAVIFCDGEIIDGKSQKGRVGNETIIASLRSAKEDKSIKAIILRVNSPGGSGLASELIHREIELTQKVKPVYTSMGNVAASGGYYIACNSKRIFADKETLTGSIGVFGLIPNIKALADKWGINGEQVQTHPNALTYSFFEETSEKTKEVISEGIELFYQKFVQRVADGRKLTWNQVDSLAQGRVWTGVDALKNGLIDQIGDLNNTIEYVAGENKLPKDYIVLSYPIIEMEVEDYLKARWNSSTKAELQALLREEIGKETYDQLQRIKAPMRVQGSLQARIPFNLEVK
ncbi:signal peptide peptidase SppA [uncultured Capnocytophaga sp.]|uniref:signal peptide peptidase SppA n=1 Tax=uncultured Capnocytophaga sp. TaxID=159273 RepID=UPI0026277FD9|nr:signal peptide peptidase SppA [uncultured Capnocytophaga sp.]